MSTSQALSPAAIRQCLWTTCSSARLFLIMLYGIAFRVDTKVIRYSVEIALTFSLPEWKLKSLKVTLTFEFVDKILWCDHLNETFSAVLSQGTIYWVCSSNFWVRGRTKFYDLTIQMKPLCLYFQMMLFVFKILQNENLGIYVELCPWPHLAMKGVTSL